MNTFLEAFLNGWWQGILFTGLVWLVLRDLPRVSAATKTTIWQVTMLIVALLPLLQRIPLPTEAVTIDTNVIREQAPRPSQPRPTVQAPLVEISDHSPNVFFGIAVALAALQLLRLAVGYAMLRRLKRKATLTAVTLPVPIPRAVRVLLSDQVGMPVAVGYRHPAILMPRAMAGTLEEEQLRHVLLHESAHLLRRDDWLALVERLFRAIFFFQPAMHFIGRQIEREREIACDDWVVEQLGAAKPYAASLARVAELSSGLSVPLLATGAGSPKQIFQRLEVLLDQTRNRFSGVSGTAVLAATCALLFVVSQGKDFSRLLGLDHYNSRWIESDGSHRREVKLRGELGYTSSDDDVEWMSPGAKLSLESADGWRSKRIEFEANADGKIERRYIVDGTLHAWDAEARRYAAKTLPPWIREQGTDIERRTAKMLAQGGVSTAIEDIRAIGRADVKRAYLEELLLHAKLDEIQLLRILRVAGDIGSDQEKRQFFERIGDLYLDRGMEAQTYEFIDSIRSNEDRKSLLQQMLARGIQGEQRLARFARSVEKIDSDQDKMELLSRAALDAKGKLPEAFYQAASTIRSEADRQTVMESLILAHADLPKLLGMIRALHAQHSKAALLTELSRNVAGDADALAELSAVAKELSAASDRAEVLRVLEESRLTGTPSRR